MDILALFIAFFFLRYNKSIDSLLTLMLNLWICENNDRNVDKNLIS